VPGERRRRALIRARRATEGGSGATHHTVNVRRWGVLKRSDSFRLFLVSIVIAEIADSPGKRQFRAV